MPPPLTIIKTIYSLHQNKHLFERVSVIYERKLHHPNNLPTNIKIFIVHSDSQKMTNGKCEKNN